jgi:hypothetical protein
MRIKFTYTRQRFVIIVLLITVCFSSCKKNKQKEDATKIVKEWTGKEIKFPRGIPCTSMGKDTTCVDLYCENYKILLYVDSAGCTSCKLKLYEWKKIIAESDSVFSNPPEFIFFFQPKQKDEKELQQIFKNNGFNHPIFIDKENEINKLNKFPSKPEYQCFLLDKNNKVVIVGDPSVNRGIWDLFKRTITEIERK